MRKQPTCSLTFAVALLLAVFVSLGHNLLRVHSLSFRARAQPDETPAPPEPKPSAETISSKNAPDTYSYIRSDLNPESPFYIPPSLRYSHFGAGPASWPRSRLEQGVPLAQPGFKSVGESGVTPEKVAEWEKGLPPRTANGMPADFAPNPIDPPNYKAGAEAGAEAAISEADIDAGLEW